jgi:uncharacterized protein YcnI
VRTRRLLSTAVATAALLLAPLTGPAAAHVTVQGPGATQGGYSKLTFRAPTEKDVPTTQLEIAFPSEHPIASVRVKPQPGWDYTLTKGAPAVPLEAHGQPVTEVVQRITWTATGEGIGPTEFGEFEVSAGRLPEVDQLVFKALQTYADGEVVRWIEEPVEGGEEPEKPAPVLTLDPVEPEGDDEALAQDVSVENASAVTPADGDSAATPLAAAALTVGVVALLLAGYAAVRSRRAHT